MTSYSTVINAPKTFEGRRAVIDYLIAEWNILEDKDLI